MIRYRMRPILLLAALGGCNVVVALDEVAAPAPTCGPYGPAEVVAFDPSIAPLRDFSVDGTGTAAMVFAQVSGGPSQWVALADAGGVWVQDVARTIPVGAPYMSVHLGVSKNDAFVAYQGGTGVQVTRFGFTTGWAPNVAQFYTQDPRFDWMPGSEIDLGVDRNRYVSLVGVAREELVDNVGTLAYALPNNSWQTWSEDLGNDHSRLHDFNAGVPGGLQPIGMVFANAGLTMVVDGRQGGLAGPADLYTLSRLQRSDDFARTAAQIDGVNTALDELDPWVNADCSTIWFRRKDPSRTADPGMIYVAHKK